MSTQITLSLPDNVYHQATRLAQLMNQDVSLVLAETLENALSPLGSSATNLTPVEELSDPKVLELVDLRMDKVQGKRLGKLLDRQQSGQLNNEERNELAGLMQVYHESLVRKAQALSEAVRRGLREALTE
jgi:hypothetical protein